MCNATRNAEGNDKNNKITKVSAKRPREISRSPEINTVSPKFAKAHLNSTGPLGKNLWKDDKAEVFGRNSQC